MTVRYMKTSAVVISEFRS